MKKLFFLAAVAAIGLVACNKSETALNTPVQKSPQKVDLSAINGGNRIFTDEQIEQIGRMHNETVIDFFSNFNYNTDDIYAELIKQVSQLDISPMEIAKLPEGVSTSEYYDMVLKANLSGQAHSFIYEVANSCVGFSNVNDLAQYVELSKSYAKENFKGVELDVVLTALTVFKYSSQLWFSEEGGGKGLGIIFADNCEKTEIAQAPAQAPYKISAATKELLIRCLIADGESAAQATVVVGLMAVVYPINTAAIISIAVSAGVGSVWKLISILMERGVLAPIEPDIVIKWQDYIEIDGIRVTLPLTNQYFPINNIIK